MSFIIRTFVWFCLLTLAGAANAAAQSRTLGFISINAGYQPTMSEFDDSFSFTRDQETGSTGAIYPIDAGPTFDIGGGVRLWRGLGVGLAVSRFSRDGVVRTSSSIPHPLYLERHRQVDGEAGGIRREETGIHVQAQFTIPLSSRLRIMLVGGPSILQVNQAMAIDVNYNEAYPYDTAAFSGVDSSARQDTKTGYNVGADIGWMFTRNVGAGLLLRYSRATVDLETAEGRTLSVDAGGAQVGIGLRMAF